MQPPFVGPSYNLESRPASVQRTVNMVPVPLEPGNERAGWGFEDVPGLSQFTTDPGPGPDPDQPDPLWPYVVLLIQNGEVIDKSSYGRALTTIGGITAEVSDGGMPSGKSIHVSGDVATCGISWFFSAITTPELVFGTDEVCIETFFRMEPGRIGPQIIYGDEYGMRSSGIVLAPGGNFGDGVRCDLNTPPGPGGFGAPALVNSTRYHVALQIVPGVSVTMYLQGTGWPIVGHSIPASIFDPVSPSTPPCIGRMGGQAGTENFYFEQYRITRGIARYTGPTITIPTDLFPEFGP